MDIATIQPVMGLPHLQQVLQATLPQYTFVIRANSLVVGHGLCTGLQLKLATPSCVRTSWVIPNMAVQIMWSLTMVLTGIIPGLLVYGLIYLIVKSDVVQIEQHIQTILRGGAVPHQSHAIAQHTAPTNPPKPGSLPLVGAAVSTLIALGSLGVFADQLSEYVKMRNYARQDRIRSLLSAYSARSSYGSYRSYNSYDSYGGGSWTARRATARAENAALALLSGLIFTALTATLLVMRQRQLSRVNTMPSLAMPNQQQWQPSSQQYVQGAAMQAGGAYAPGSAQQGQWAAPSYSQSGSVAGQATSEHSWQERRA
jgi:hypothetical protein